MSPPIAPAAPAPEQVCRRMCRPGYTSRSKILRSAKRMRIFLLNKVEKCNKVLKSENIKLQQDVEASFTRHKDFFDLKHKQILAQYKVSIDRKYEEYFSQFKIENSKLKKQVESSEEQLAIAKRDKCKFHTVQMEPIDLSFPKTTPAISGYTRVPRKLASASLPGD